MQGGRGKCDGSILRHLMPFSGGSMRCLIRLAAMALALCLTDTGLFAQQQIVLIATITDPAGAEVTSVDPADVEFTENGTAGTVVKVEAVAAVIPKIQILIDNGLGIPSASLGDLRTAVKGLINAL